MNLKEGVPIILLFLAASFFAATAFKEASPSYVGFAIFSFCCGLAAIGEAIVNAIKKSKG